MYACYTYVSHQSLYTQLWGCCYQSVFTGGTYFQIHESSPRKLLLFIFYTIFRPLHIQNNNNNRNEIIIACSHKIINTYSLNVILLFLPSKIAASAAIANSSYQFCPLNGGQAYFSNWFSTPLLLDLLHAVCSASNQIQIQNQIRVAIRAQWMLLDFWIHLLIISANLINTLTHCERARNVMTSN